MGVVLKQNTSVWTVTQTLYMRTGNCQMVNWFFLSVEAYPVCGFLKCSPYVEGSKITIVDVLMMAD